MNLAPLVIPRRESRRGKLLSEAEIRAVEAANFEELACFDDGLCCTVEEDAAALELTGSELLRGDDERAVAAIAQENTAFAGSDKYTTVSAFVN